MFLRSMLVLFLSCLSVNTLGQSLTVSGTVTDEKGEPIIGASVLVMGTTNGSITNFDGIFTLNNVASNAQITISYIGMKSQTLSVNGKTSFKIVLKEDSEVLDEVVVVGYGTQKKVNLTGAVTMADGDVLEDRPIANVTQGLQGAIPNLNITFDGGSPNATAQINVRGTTSLNGGSALILVDGVETNDISLLNPQDIASISVLKDASSAAVYGARAAFGDDEAGVVQSEANYYMVLASISDLKNQIRETENALSLLLRQAPQKIERGKLEDQQLPTILHTGVPVQLLSNRPDVKAAEMALAGTYYNANEARAAFYPSISISGTYGWTNQAGNTIINPGKMIASAIGSLTQPLFYRGANIARLKIAKAQQAEAMLSFEQAILNAGADVSDALSLYQSAEDKRIQRVKQINSLEKSVEYTQELLTLGTSNTNYLEVLTAQQSLLNAQLSGISDEFQRLQAVVNLYHALGGGTK